MPSAPGNWGSLSRMPQCSEDCSICMWECKTVWGAGRMGTGHGKMGTWAHWSSRVDRWGMRLEGTLRFAEGEYPGSGRSEARRAGQGPGWCCSASGFLLEGRGSHDESRMQGRGPQALLVPPGALLGISGLSEVLSVSWSPFGGSSHPRQLSLLVYLRHGGLAQSSSPKHSKCDPFR